MCPQTVKRFYILLRETFCNSIALTLINKYGKGAVVQIWTVFGPVYHVAFCRVFRNGTFFFKRGIFFMKMFKNWSTFWKWRKNREKVFPFRDICLWVGGVKLSLLRTEYFWRTVNVLKNSPKILLIYRSEIFEINSFQLINKYCKGGVIQTSALFDPIYHVAFCRVFRNGTF